MSLLPRIVGRSGDIYVDEDSDLSLLCSDNAPSRNMCNAIPLNFIKIIVGRNCPSELQSRDKHRYNL